MKKNPATDRAYLAGKTRSGQSLHRAERYRDFPISVMLLIAALITVISCTPSDVVFKKYAEHDFQTEGFLTRNILQTIGRAAMPEGQLSHIEARKQCLEKAYLEAEKKMLNVFLHTKLDIPSAAQSGFERDYPHPFTDRDLIRAYADFYPLLENAFIALQDTRSYRECTLVLRIRSENIPRHIRNIEMTFEPEESRIPEGRRPTAEDIEQSDADMDASDILERIE